MPGLVDFIPAVTGVTGGFELRGDSRLGGGGWEAGQEAVTWSRSDVTGAWTRMVTVRWRCGWMPAIGELTDLLVGVCVG